MPDNINNNLMPHLIRFVKTLTNKQQLTDLFVQIQQQLEQGHTAIEYSEQITSELISNDGSSGYIVQRNNKIGFRRLFNQEMYIHNQFNNCIQLSHDIKRGKQIKDALIQVLKYHQLDDTTEIDWQWQASLAFLFQHRFILNGSPGTGKTTTVIRMIQLYLELNPNNNIALAAPTGKAANRMMGGINSILATMKLPEFMHDKLALPAQTLHRLLGYNPLKNQLKYNKNNKLDYNLVIIDEASMLDTSMTYALLQALKTDAQLVLIGDKNQLPAVEAGNVFADLCAILSPESSSPNKPPINLLKEYLNGQDCTKKSIEKIVELKKSYRFTQGSIIAQLCDALIAKNLALFNSYKNNNQFTWSNPVSRKIKEQNLKNWYDSIHPNQTKILLSPTNFGDNSVDELNNLAIKLLYGNSNKHENMPIMVTKNDYTLGIFNGDIGNLTSIENKWHVTFGIEAKKQNIQLDAISQWQTAHAISIHKSQGSEYDHVLIAIPDDSELEILSNQLLYTAISRAKISVTIWASEVIIAKIISSSKHRITFLN